MKVRSMKKYGISYFNDQLRSHDWFKVCDGKYLNIPWDIFIKIVQIIIDRVTPVNLVSVKQRSEFGFSNEILNCIQIKNMLCK